MSFGSIRVTPHACEEAVKDFRIPRQTADEWIRSNLRKAKFVANIVNEKDEPRRLYALNRIAFILAPDTDTVITVHPRHISAAALQTKIQSLIQRELRKLERKERTTEREVTVQKARLAVEAAECRLKMAITPSAKVKRTNTERLTKIDEELAALDRKLIEVKREKSTFAKGVVMYV